MLPRALKVIDEDLDRVCAHCFDTAKEDFVKSLQKGEAYLHLAFRGEGYIGFAICQIAPLENGPIASIKALGGDGVLDAIDMYENELRRIGCKVATFPTTRKGWARKAIGYEPAYTTYRKVL